MGSEVDKIEERIMDELNTCDTPIKLLVFISSHELEPEESSCGFNPNRQEFLRRIIDKIYQWEDNGKQPLLPHL